MAEEIGNTPDPSPAAPLYTIPSGRVTFKVNTIAMDTDSKNPVMILTDLREFLYLPIWIGPLEGAAITKILENRTDPRPMTHDLFHSILVAAGGRVSEVVIVNLEEQTYFAKITLNDATGHRSEQDARPSDAVALALRFGAPIYVTSAVIDKAAIADKSKLFDAAAKLGGGPVPLE